ncbi:hypothetical protein [Luteibacter sp. UNCMF366Tsu5.1]|uniref:hypothetical protein n=1 Tax=Luteibacter sp. UNCMF366Tsu5.1 TaxID=1502758 RepID=UPI0009091D05|nr:hypothetical protein [Luteibacter sp. UNCMF366Tsu5.1]SFW34904.1 hypothetical protein SAMN02800691_1235 [Luteibacter sp. UNCMF366Tsu5.1]
MPRIGTVLLAVIAIAGCVRPPPTGTTGRLVFYAGNDGQGKVVCTVPVKDGTLLRSTFAERGCGNDEIHSLRYENAKQDAALWIYDRPDCGDSEDNTVITFTASAPSVVVKTFDESKTQKGYDINYSHPNRDKGKASCFIVNVPGTGPQANTGLGKGAKAVAFVRFYEGYGASQSNICTYITNTLPFFVKERICKNDEAKSVTFENTPPGSVVYVYDNPNYAESDDYSHIVTLREATPRIVVWYFEVTETKPEYAIRYYWEDGRLDGKVSSIIIDLPRPPGR